MASILRLSFILSMIFGSALAISDQLAAEFGYPAGVNVCEFKADGFITFANMRRVWESIPKDVSPKSSESVQLEVNQSDLHQ